MTRCRRIATLVLGPVLSLGTALAQDSGLAPQSSLVPLDQECTFSSTPLVVDGEVVVLWEKRDSAILARRGPDLDNLGPETLLVQGQVSGFEAIAAPDGFVLFWATDSWPVRWLSLQRFGADLLPAAPRVEVDAKNFAFWRVFDLALADSGEITLAWAVDGSPEVRLQRFSAGDVPLGPVASIALPPTASVDALQLGASSLLVAWREQLDPTPTYRLHSRAYSFAGLPLGAAVDHGAGSFQLRADLAASGDGGFLSLVTRDDLFLRRLGSSGQPLEAEMALGLSTEAREPLLAARGNLAWISWRTNGGALFLTRFDLDTDGAEAPLLVDQAAGNIVPAGERLEPDGDGVLLGWRQAVIPVILPNPCDSGFATYARAFGPDGRVVEVPTMTDLGLAICILLFALAGVLIRRCV